MPSTAPSPPRPHRSTWRRLIRRLLPGLPLLLALSPLAAFDLQGHRGARGHAPENTLAGFAAALRIGVDTLELDLALSRDGVLLISHDARLNPVLTRDASGRWLDEPTPALASLSLAEAQAFDVGRIRPDSDYARRFAGQRPADGERIPTLQALLDRLRRWGATGVRLNIEIKTDPRHSELSASPEAFAQALVSLLRRHGMLDRVSVQSFDWRGLRQVQRLAPQLPTVALTAQQRWLDNVSDPRWTAGLRLADHRSSVPRLVQAAGAVVWSPHVADLTPQALAEAHALGLRVLPWTVNEPAQIERLLDWGVDGLISDYPDRVRSAMAARGMALPASLPIAP